jgi:hypothetical protein
MKTPPLALLFAVAGCAAEAGPDLIAGFDPPRPSDDELQLIAPAIYAIAPGEDVTLCSYIDYRTERELDVTHYQGYQSELGGHHAILYAVTQKQAPNTHPCNESDMLSSRYLAGAGEVSPADLPAGVVFRMPADTQLMIQTHWINTTDHPIDGQSAFNLRVTEPKPEHQPAQLVTIVNTLFTLPEGPASTTADCEIREGFNVFALGGHMHEWGTHTRITYTPATATAAQTIYETDWTPTFQSDPPRNHYTLEDPFVMSVGDKVHIDCDYMNDTGAPIPFPREMCVAFAYGYPLENQINCVNNTWTN